MSELKEKLRIQKSLPIPDVLFLLPLTQIVHDQTKTWIQILIYPGTKISKLVSCNEVIKISDQLLSKKVCHQLKCSILNVLPKC